MSTLLRRAVSEAYSTGTNYAAESQAMQYLSKNLDRLFALQDSLTVRGNLTREVALEAEIMTGQKGFVSAYEKAVSGHRIKSVALEGVFSSIFSAIGAAIKKVFELIGRFFSWLFGGSGSSGGSSGGGGGQPIAKPEQVKKVDAAVEKVGKAEKKAKQAMPNKAKVDKAVKEAAKKAPAAQAVAKPALKGKARNMSDKEKEEYLETLAKPVAAAMHRYLKPKKVTDILSGGPYAKKMVEFIRSINFREFDIEIESILKDSESIFDKFLERAKELDAEVQPTLKDAADGNHFGANREGYSKFNDFDKEVQTALDTLKTRYEDNEVTSKILLTLTELSNLEDTVSGDNTEADLDKINVADVVDVSSVNSFLDQARFAEVSTIIANSGDKIDAVQNKVMERWNQYQDVWEKQEESQPTPAGSAVARVYRAYAFQMNALHNMIATYGHVVKEVNKFYKDSLRAVNAVIHINDAIFMMAEMAQEVMGEEASPAMMSAIKQYQEVAEEFRKLVKDLK